jgi:hypothetical protein
MAKKQQKVASWYWNITAILTPFVLVAGLVLIYFQHLSDVYAAESERIYQQVDRTHKNFRSGELITTMRDVAQEIGFDMGDIFEGVGQVQPGEVPRSVRASVLTPEELMAPRDEQSPVTVRYLDTDRLFFGQDGEGFVHEYAAARRWLRELDQRVRRYLAFKSYHYYTVATIEIEGEEAAVAEGDLRRQVIVRGGVIEPDPGALDRAWTRQQEHRQPPADSGMKPPVEVTLELVFRRQMQLLADLARVNHHQHNLLFADVSGQTEVQMPDGRRISVGAAGEDQQRRHVIEQLETLERRINERTATSTRRLDTIDSATGDIELQTVDRIRRINLVTESSVGRLEDLSAQFSGELAAHQEDADRFEDMIRNLPRIKTLIRIDRAISDGEVSYSDYGRRVCHINLGASDGVVAGQRFEVWRRHGREQDQIVGVIEVVRTLSAHYSLCSVIGLVDESDPVRKNDTIVSRIWSNGRFHSVALHGTFEPPNQVYSKERLSELLAQAGCRVVDRVQPGVDLVVLGSRLFSDQWYREARNDLRFDTIREEEIRLYVDPR